MTPYMTNPSTLAARMTQRQCQMYNANKHENPKIVQRDASEVRDEVPAKKGPKRLLMKAELRLLCLGIGGAHGIQIGNKNTTDTPLAGGRPRAARLSMFFELVRFRWKLLLLGAISTACILWVDFNIANTTFQIDSEIPEVLLPRVVHGFMKLV